ncbi:conserved hypothetical protein [Prosthecochloris aestuarii DSM 271]|uniref:Coiled coil domain-containing protein n=1 Tax=Prosthecochloris aestuarii (strain DSM 271 / SK 413) TaxID=290512 RepID=B4S8Q7_PROA2|nr:hypothetical protein [Prosthecochloris aestuarii]ACF46444.1 conserved hypothetical protein [Prosthecochloris aestuarii DSM 271]
MSLKEAYKQKAEAELELAHARLVEFKAKAKSFTADTRLKYVKHVDELEHGIKAAKVKLKDLGDAGEDTWEKVKDGMDNALGSLRQAVRNTADKFKE